MPISRKKNYIHTASGIFALCKRLPSTLVGSGLQSAPNQCTVEDNNVTNILLMNKENFALKLVDEIILYYDARSKKHQNDHQRLGFMEDQEYLTILPVIGFCQLRNLRCVECKVIYKL